MKVKLFTPVIAVLIIFNTGCFGGEKMGFNERTRKNTQMAEIIINCISEKDSAALREVFCPDTLEKSKTLDEDINRLFAYCNGKVSEYKEVVASSFTHIDMNLNSTEFNDEYDFTIGDTPYILLFIYFPKNTIDIRQEGVKTIQVIKKEDEEKYICYWEDMEPGIFVPVQAVSADFILP